MSFIKKRFFRPRRGVTIQVSGDRYDTYTKEIQQYIRDGYTCPKCGSTNTNELGMKYGILHSYQYHSCKSCKTIYKQRLNTEYERFLHSDKINESRYYF